MLLRVPPVGLPSLSNLITGKLITAAATPRSSGVHLRLKHVEAGVLYYDAAIHIALEVVQVYYFSSCFSDTVFLAAATSSQDARKRWYVSCGKLGQEAHFPNSLDMVHTRQLVEKQHLHKQVSESS